MKFDDTYKLIAIVIAGVVLAVVVFIIFSCYMDKRKKLQLQEQPPTPQPLREIVSAPTYQPRNIDVVNDRLSLWGKNDTIVKKSIPPLRPYQAPKTLESKRDDGRIVVLDGASTSAFGGGCAGSSGGDSGCGGSHTGGGHSSGGGGCGGGGGGGGCGGS